MIFCCTSAVLLVTLALVSSKRMVGNTRDSSLEANHAWYSRKAVDHPKGEWKVMLVRHGESINNILSQSKSLKRYQTEGALIFDRKLAMQGSRPGTDVYSNTAGGNMAALMDLMTGTINLDSSARDTFLSDTGEQSAHVVRHELFPLVRSQTKWPPSIPSAGSHLEPPRPWSKDLCLRPREDRYGLLTGDDPYQAVYVSPLRRTIATALSVFGAKAAEIGNISFKAAPWAHEQLKSVSDLGHNTSVLMDFTEKYAEYDGLGMANPLYTDPVQSLNATLGRLPIEWSTTKQPEAENMTYYPLEKGKPVSEDGKRKNLFCERIQRIERWITTLPERKLIIVTHSAVIRKLFDRFLKGRKPDNIGMFVGTLVSKGGSALPYWTDISPLRSIVASPPNADENNKIPVFLPSKKNEISVGRSVSFKKGCSFHVGILEAGPVEAVKCPNEERRGRCLPREIGLTVDGYLIRSDGKYFQREETCSNCVHAWATNLLNIQGSVIYISTRGKAHKAGKVPWAKSKSWKQWSGNTTELDETKPISVKVQEPEGKPLVRLHLKAQGFRSFLEKMKKFCIFPEMFQRSS